MYRPLAVTTAFFLVAGMSHAATMNTVTLGDDDCFGSGLSGCDDGVSLDDLGIATTVSAVDLTPVDVDNRTASDPANTDHITFLGNTFFDFGVSLGGQTVTSASITIKTAAIDLAFGSAVGGTEPAGTSFFFEGTFLGTHANPQFTLDSSGNQIGIGVDGSEQPLFLPDGSFNTLFAGYDTSARRNIAVLTYSIPVSLISDGVLRLGINPENDFGLASTEHYGIDFVSLNFTTEDSTPPKPEIVPLPAPILLLASAFLGLGAWRRSRR